MSLTHREKVNNINIWRDDIKLKYGYIDFYNQYSEDLINQIFDLVIDDKIDASNINYDYIRYLGYYYYLKGNIEEMKKCFQTGIDNGDEQSFVDYAIYYINDDFENSKEIGKELLMKMVEKENVNGMYRLAVYYTHNIFNEDSEFCDKESDKLFDKLIELNHHQSIDFLGEFYMNRNPEKSREYFKKIIDNGNISGNFGIIRLGCNHETEKELLCEIVEKWDINRCTIKNMANMFGLLARDNVDTNFLMEHCQRLGFKNDDLTFKIQAITTVLKNKLKYAKYGECPICMEEKDLIPFDCFGHFFCVECEKKTIKCSLCRISRNQLLYDN